MVRAGDAEGAKQTMEHHLTSVEPNYQLSGVSA
jgi:DNA-binding FadR family transcriptional regulator